MQATMFDLGRTRRDAGLASLERHSGFLARARMLARLICLERGTVTTDDLQARLTRPLEAHVNIWGAILRSSQFVPTGEFVHTRRPEGHARRIQVWRLVER
jgi:hypothetical protein